MTTAEMLRAEGFADGHDEGRAEGYADGRIAGFAEGVAEVFVQWLTMKGGRPVPRNVAEYVHMTVRQAVCDMSIDRLKVWMARVAAAETLDEILDWLSSACPEPTSGARESHGADCEESSREG